MSKDTASSTSEPHCGDSQSELAETATLPLLPDVSGLSSKAANDTAFSLSDNSTNEGLKRLIELAESIDKRLESIAEVLATTQSPPVSGKKKEVTREEIAACVDTQSYVIE